QKVGSKVIRKSLQPSTRRNTLARWPPYGVLPRAVSTRPLLTAIAITMHGTNKLRGIALSSQGRSPHGFARHLVLKDRIATIDRDPTDVSDGAVLPYSQHLRTFTALARCSASSGQDRRHEQPHSSV